MVVKCVVGSDALATVTCSRFNVDSSECHHEQGLIMLVLVWQGAVMKPDMRALWEQLFADPSKFDDFRQYKADKGGAGADFRHKETSKSLW